MSEDASGASAPAYVSHGKSLWIIGDYAHEMVDVAHAVGYRTGHVQLVQRSSLTRSDAKREIQRIDAERPDLLVVILLVDHHNDAKKIAKEKKKSP